MTNRARTVLLGAAAAAIASLAIPPSAFASWESARSVDNPGSTAQTVGATGSYTGLADGGGNSTAFFEQSVGGSNGYFAIRRGAADAAWSAPRGISTPSAASATQPISAGADASGDAVGLSVQNAGGVPGIFASIWPVGAQAPSGYSQLMSTPPAQSGLTDPEVAFDSSANGYAVAGEGQGGTTSTDEPILISTYVNGKWSTPTPIIVQSPGGTTTCTNSAIATKGEVCGQEPRMAVSPDGSIVVVFLETVSQIPMVSNQEELFAVTAPSHAALAKGGSGFSFIHQISANQVPDEPAPQAGSADYPPNFDVALDSSDVATVVDAESASGENNQVRATQWTVGSPAPGSSVQLSSSSPTAPPASEPRVTTSPGGDATVVWTESSQSSPPPADALLASELAGAKWSPATTITGSADSPANPAGYAVNTPPFSISEDSDGNVFLVWTNGGALQDSIRQLDKGWSAVDTISGVTGTIGGTARVAASNGQADALVVAGNGSRNALYASRFSGTLPPPRNTPPLSTTGSAGSITQTSATLNGTVNPEGQDTHYHFQYGSSTSYGETTATHDAGSGITSSDVSAAITDLAPGTTYHFRLVASNTSGTTDGADQTFTTLPAPGPPGATTGPATSIGATGATLTGTVNPDAQDTKYYFQYGASTSYGRSTSTIDVGSGKANVHVAFAIGGLTPGTPYHFRIVASNAAGTRYGIDAAFRTPYAACTVRPHSRIDKRRVRASRRGLAVFGEAGEASCAHASPAAHRSNRVRKVYVTIYHAAGHGQCRFLMHDGKLSRPRPCSRPIELLAAGTTTWTLRLRAKLPSIRGGYLIRADAVDGFGRHQTRSAASVVHVDAPRSRAGRHQR